MIEAAFAVAGKAFSLAEYLHACGYSSRTVFR
jgi:hypothetical protein